MKSVFAPDGCGEKHEYYSNIVGGTIDFLYGKRQKN